MKTLFCLLSTFGIGIAAFGMAKENSSVRCQQMFQGFPSGWGIAPALAEKLYHTSPDGRLDITVGLGMIDLIEQMPNVYFDSLGFYLAMEPHLDFSVFTPEFVELVRANYKNGADLFLTRFRAVSSAVELAGEPAGSVYRKNLERTEGDLSRVLAALLCQVPSSDIRRSRSYDTFDSHIEEFLTLRRHEAPNLPQLVQHSRSLSADLAEMVALSSNGTLEDSLYPKTKADKRFMMRWLSNSLASIALDLVYDEILESAGPVTIVNMGRRIESFVQEDAMTPDGEYRGFMATLLMSTVFEYSPTRPRALREMIKSHLKANFRSLARRVAPALTPAKTAALPQSSMPATIPAALVKSRVPNTDALFAQNMRMPQTKKATHYKAETVEPNVADDLDPFISGEAGLDKLEAEKPYKVFFRRQNPFFSGPQTVVFSHLLLRDFQGHNDARSVRATDWLEAIQQGIARRWERGIKRLKSDEFSWEVKIDGTVFRILGNRVGNQSWFFQEFRAK